MRTAAALGYGFVQILIWGSAVSVFAGTSALRENELGKYLYNAAGCAHCHTVPGGAELAGGYEMETEFGTFYTPNITPDLVNGIGRWSDEEFINAVRKGRSPEGHYYYPSFPFNSYVKMSDNDVLAIKRHIFENVAPASAPNRPHDLKFPYHFRSLMAGWRVLNFKPPFSDSVENFLVGASEFKPRADKSARWNRGAYLVEGVLHCTQCHTPRTASGGLDVNKWFAGTTSAPEISSSTTRGIGGWSREELTHFFKTGINSSGRVMAEGMDKVIESTRELSDGDIQAMIDYLLDPIVRIRDPESRLAVLRRGRAGSVLPASLPKLGVSSSSASSQPFHVEWLNGLTTCPQYLANGDRRTWVSFLNREAELIADRRYNYRDYDSLKKIFDLCQMSMARAGVNQCLSNLHNFSESVGKVGRPGHNYGFIQSDEEYFSDPRRQELVALPPVFADGFPEGKDWERLVDGWEYVRFRSRLVGNPALLYYDRITFYRSLDEFDQWIQFTVAPSQTLHPLNAYADSDYHGNNSYIDVITVEKQRDGRVLEKPKIHFREYVRDRNGRNPIHKVANSACYNCHPSGPRPFSVDALSVSPEDQIKLSHWNKRMSSYGEIDWDGSIIPEHNGPPMGRGMGQNNCIKCHNNYQGFSAAKDSDWRQWPRGALNFRTELYHLRTRMVDMLEMPPFVLDRAAPLKSALAKLMDPVDWQKTVATDSYSPLAYRVHHGDVQVSLNRMRDAGVLSRDEHVLASAHLKNSRREMDHAYEDLVANYRRELAKWLLGDDCLTRSSP